MSKNHRNKKIKITPEIEKENIPSFLKSNYIVYTLLFGIMTLAFYIRGILPWDATFANGITSFATDDAVYHMRLVENLLVNFPNRLTYDAFTLYPYGSILTWGSLYSLIIGILALIFGVNNINTIGALVPAIMGTFVVIPIYFIGAELLNKKAGLFGAFIIAILPGSFLQRSMLGFTDHHVAEVLFSTIFMMYFILAFNRVKYVPEKLFNITSLKFIISTPLKYAVLSGIFLGLYILTWTTGVLFAAIAAVFIFIQIFINYTKNISNNSLVAITTIVYGISALMILPFVELKNSFDVVFYSPAHIIILLSVISVSMFLNSLSIKLHKNNKNIFDFMIQSTISVGGFVMFIGIIIPSFLVTIFGSLDVLFIPKSGGGLTIGEAQPTDLITVYHMFGLNVMIAILAGLLLIVIYFTIENREKVLIVFIWCILMLFLLVAQNRWSYYFAINVAILSGFMCGYILDYVGKWKDIKNINIWNITILILMIFLVGFYPIGGSPYTVATTSTIGGIRSEGFYEWYETLTWMRYNTPDTGLDYNGTYIRPNNGEKYPYPNTAYGVMSWWDYGHVITYWAHRIPNTNPFQSGIGGTQKHLPGAATFLTASTENEANNVLAQLGINGSMGAKYIVSNAYMAYSIQPVFAEWDYTNVGYFQQIKTSQGDQILPTEKYYNTMESKLHIFDANGLKHYRLVHESVPNMYVSGGAQELGYKQVYNQLIDRNNPIPVEYSGYVKIFEYVKGAKIVGTTTQNTEVEIKLTIQTNIGRTIVYKQKTISNTEGKYILTVPYSTTGSIKEGTQFDTKPVGKYELSINKGLNGIINIDINEINVLNGNTVIIPKNPSDD